MDNMGSKKRPSFFCWQRVLLHTVLGVIASGRRVMLDRPYDVVMGWIIYITAESVKKISRFV